MPSRPQPSASCDRGRSMAGSEPHAWLYGCGTTRGDEPCSSAQHLPTCGIPDTHQPALTVGWDGGRIDTPHKVHPTNKASPFVAHGQFQALFHSRFQVLFIFPSRYLFAIGLSPVFSLGWRVPPALRSTPKLRDSMNMDRATTRQM